MKKLLTIIGVFCLIALSACTQNQRAKSFGGQAEYVLPKGEKLVETSWKGENLWIMTRPMKEGEEAITYKMHEESSYGFVEGTVVIKEVK